MSNNRRRHQILRIVHKSLQNTKEGVTPIAINSKMHIDSMRLVALLQELLNEGYLKGGDSKKCHMTPKGMNAYTGKEFLNQLWYRKWNNWLSIIAIIISIVALFRPN